MAFHENAIRTLAKTVTYRSLVLISNFLVTILLTRSLALATQVAGLTFLVNTLIYFVHERGWDSIGWGKKRR